jgi:hypothetical protein
VHEPLDHVDGGVLGLAVRPSEVSDLLIELLPHLRGLVVSLLVLL